MSADAVIHDPQEWLRDYHTRSISGGVFVGYMNYVPSLTNQNLKKGCYINLGGIKRSISICDKILDRYYKDWCYSGVVRAKKDPSICDKIQNQSYKDSCYRLVT